MTMDVQKPTKPALSESTVNRLLDAQARDQELKARELSIRHEELKAQSEFAHKMLSAQVGDRQSERVHISKLLSVKLGAAGVVLILVLGFLSYGMYLGKDAMVMETIKILLSTLVGAFGGYGYRAYKDKQENEQEP